MNSPILDRLLAAPNLPELIEEARRAWAREQKLRKKFYDEITPEHKWEFIQGEVVMHSPALDRHLVASQRIYDLFSAYARVHQAGIVRHEKAMTTFPRNDYEPDVMFFGTAKAALVGPETLKFPVPDLAVEVLSPSTEHRDRGVKFTDYALHGVGEYWIVDTVTESVEAHRIQGEAYPPAERQTEGMIESDVLPGFEMPVKAVFDEAENLEALKRILMG